jgi:hypothetical protein
MLNNVPKGINRMARNMVINHPNAFNCQVFRKEVTRHGEAGSGGLPTLGGLGVLDSEDEEKIAWKWIGNGFSLQTDFQPAQMMDRQDANNGDSDEFRFLIEPEEAVDTAGHFSPRRHDVLYLLYGDKVKLAYEIVGVETVLNIPPYTMRYVCNRRDELNVVLA